MDRQEVFNRVYKRAVSMEKPAFVDGCCMYRSENGPCLIGSLITDEAYNPKIEHCGASDLCVVEVLIKSGVEVETESDEKFLCALQAAHDNNIMGWYETGKTKMINELSRIAIAQHLKVPNDDLV